MGKIDPCHNTYLFYTKGTVDFISFSLTVVNYSGEGDFTYDISGAGADILGNL